MKFNEWTHETEVVLKSIGGEEEAPEPAPKIEALSQAVFEGLMILPQLFANKNKEW